MITLSDIPENIVSFIEWATYISAFMAGVLIAFNVLKKEESFVDFLTGDIDDL